jgi:hypothetical protein
MPISHTFSPLLFGFLPTTPYNFPIVFFLEQHNHPFKGPCCLSRLVSPSLGCCVKVDGYWRFVLPYGQAKDLPFHTCFLYNPKFRQADCSAAKMQGKIVA